MVGIDIDIDIDVMRAHERARVELFYSSVGDGGGVALDDMVLVARRAGRIMGVVRLCDEAGVIVPRGMHAAPAAQRQRIGRTLLARCAPNLDRRRAFCLPYAYLTGFTAQSGSHWFDPRNCPVY